MSMVSPAGPEFAYAQPANPIATLLRARRQTHRSQRVGLYWDVPTFTTRLRSRPVEAMTCSQPEGTYTEEPLRYGDIQEPASEKPDDDNQATVERVRAHDSGPIPTAASDADQASSAELLPGSTRTHVSGQDGSLPDNSHPPVNTLVFREAVHEEIQAYWSAPLPPPETLREYDQILPGAAERILSMTERVVTGKIDIEEKYANGEIRNADKSLNLAFGLTLLAFAASVVFFVLVNQVAGVAFISFPVLMIIRAFLLRSDRNGPADNAAP